MFLPQWAQRHSLVLLFPGDDLMQHNAEAVHVHSVAGCMLEVHELRGHVGRGASLQQIMDHSQDDNGVFMLIRVFRPSQPHPLNQSARQDDLIPYKHKTITITRVITIMIKGRALQLTNPIHNCDIKYYH
jgi:hypothetical protein